ncbi:MAG: MFS transporter [Zoogloeaceae bacterium]|jgi:MFS family permease|nr:MFS transporter [Zoogloeaceae bacterium]
MPPVKNLLRAFPAGIYRNSGFRAFLLARLAGMFATQVQATVVVWQTYERTHDALALAYVGLAQFLPMLFLLMPAGDLMDRRARKPILVASWSVALLCACSLWRISGQGGSGMTGIYLTLLLFGASRAFSGPAVQSLLPQIVPRAQLAQAIAANGMLMRAASIGGPLLGGFLYAWGGGVCAYAVCALCFLLGVLLLFGVETRHAGERAANTGTMWRRFILGIAFIRERPLILGSISLDLFAVLLGGAVALLPIYAEEILHVGAQGLGALRSALALGEVGVGLFLSVHPFNRNVGRNLFIAVSVFGLANLLFACSRVFWLSFAALMLAGAADMVSVYIRGALVQFSTPDAMRGRVSAVNMLFIGASNDLGEFRAGVFAACFGAVPAAVIGSLCTLGVVGLWSWRFKPLRQVGRFEEAAEK